jgi:prepilin-type N-terminal cleavage/methylation domain-containing protein
MILYRPHIQRGRRGFTLIELLCATLVMVLVMVATSVAIGTATQTYTGNQDQAEVNQVARILMAHIARAIRATEDVALYSNGIKLINPTGSTVSEAIYHISENQLYLHRIPAEGAETNTILLGSAQGFVITSIEPKVYNQDFWVENDQGQVVSVNRPRLVSVKLSFRLKGQSTDQTIEVSSCPRINQAE